MTITMSSSHSPNFPSLHLHHSSFSNPSVASPTSQLILQPFCCFTYVTAHSPTLNSLLLRHSLFSYVTWRAADGFITIDYLANKIICGVVYLLLVNFITLCAFVDTTGRILKILILKTTWNNKFMLQIKHHCHKPFKLQTKPCCAACC